MGFRRLSAAAALLVVAFAPAWARRSSKWVARSPAISRKSNPRGEAGALAVLAAAAFALWRGSEHARRPESRRRKARPQRG
jgi:hypothetical protein